MKVRASVSACVHQSQVLSARGTALLFLVAATATGCGGGSDDSTAQPTVKAAVATSITTQPIDLSVTAGNPARFSVITTGTALTYQWQVSANGGTDWTDIPGATGPIYLVSVTPFDLNGYKFRVMVAGAAGRVISSPATLSLGTSVVAPTITIQSAPVSVTAGEDAVFSVTASGTSLAYQWQLSLDNLSWTDVVDAVSPTLRLTGVSAADNGKRYRVVITNASGRLTSTPVMLSVAAASVAPLITSQPAARNVVSPQTATFSVLSTGNPVPTYQWQVSTDGAKSFTDIANADAASYTTPATTVADSGKLYRVRVTNAAGSVFSANVALTVTALQAAPSFTLAPESQAVVVGAQATFTSAATGSPTPVYQWRSAMGTEAFANVNGATSPAYVTPPATLADHCKKFQVLISNSVGSLLSSDLTLTVTSAAPTPSPLQSRLSGAAYFQPELNATILADANLPATLPLGVTGINADGTMTWATAKTWVQALNAARYLGFSDWRLPAANPINGCGFVYNPPRSDPQSHAGTNDLGYGISAQGTRYARSTKSELAYLYYNVFGGTPKYAPNGTVQTSSSGPGAVLKNLTPREYWTANRYGDNDGAALVFHMRDGFQFGYVAVGPGQWFLPVIVVRTGDVTGP